MAYDIKIKDNYFTLRPSIRRKHISIGIDDESGTFYIAYPAAMAESALLSAIAEDTDKIVDRLRTKTPEIKKHTYAEGELFFLRGTEYPLRYSDMRQNALDFDGHAFFVSPFSASCASPLFEKWYSRALYYDLKTIMPLWTKRISVCPVNVSVKTVRSIWGSCSAGGNITFSTRLVMVPPPLLEYVVVHELCHMKNMNHSKQFWGEVGEYIPDYRAKRSSLKKDGMKYRWQ